MMKSAYNETWLHNLEVVKAARQWMKHNFISQDQFTAISTAHPSSFFHPNFIIRILIFIATSIALSGVTGMLGLIVEEANPGEEVIAFLCVIYGAASLFFLDKVIIGNAKQYKSGVTECLLYHSEGFIIGGVAGLFDFNIQVFLWTALAVLTFSAWRYIDLLSTLASLLVGAYIIFYEFYEMGGMFRNIIPFVFLLSFTPLYFLFHRVRQRKSLALWRNSLLIAEAFSLVVIYAAGNYLVVRELSVNLMDMQLLPGEDIPFAYLFYFLTVAIPVIYLYAGITRKDMVLIRTSLIVFAFAVFTFKYYFSTGHHEITFTVGGAFLLAVSLLLLRYLKIPQNGYTRENIMSEKWGNANIEAFLVSQTLGGNKAPVEDPAFRGGGGSFGGGGATGQY